MQKTSQLKSNPQTFSYTQLKGETMKRPRITHEITKKYYSKTWSFSISG